MVVLGNFGKVLSMFEFYGICGLGYNLRFIWGSVIFVIIVWFLFVLFICSCVIIKLIVCVSVFFFLVDVDFLRGIMDSLIRVWRFV